MSLSSPSLSVFVSNKRIVFANKTCSILSMVNILSESIKHNIVNCWVSSVLDSEGILRHTDKIEMYSAVIISQKNTTTVSLS